MAKIKLGSAPESISHSVRVKLLDGSTGDIKVKYRYRNRKDFGVFMDEYQVLAKELENEKDLPAAEVQDRVTRLNGHFLVGALVWWDLDDDLDEANLIALANEYPLAAAKLIGDYHNVCIEGRLGN